MANHNCRIWSEIKKKSTLTFKVKFLFIYSLRYVISSITNHEWWCFSTCLFVEKQQASILISELMMLISQLVVYNKHHRIMRRKPSPSLSSILTRRNKAWLIGFRPKTSYYDEKIFKSIISFQIRKQKKRLLWLLLNLDLLLGE